MSTTTYAKKGATIKFTPSPSWSATEKTLSTAQVHSGFSQNVNRLAMSGKSVSGKSVTVAQIKITANTGKYFSTSPYLSGSLKRKFKLRLRNIVSSSSDDYVARLPTEYLYDLVLRGSSRDRFRNDSKIRLLFKTDNIPSYTKAINRITFGTSNIMRAGETRTITIHGIRGSTFGVAVNETLHQVDTGKDGTIDSEDYFDKNNDISILNKNTVNAKDSHNYGKHISIIKDVIGSNGTYSFQQKFPSVISRKTYVNGAFSSVAKIKFSNLNNVRVGDRIYSSNISTSTVAKVSVLNPDGDDPNECTLDTSVTLADKADVRFERRKFFSIDIIPDLTSTLGSSFPKIDPPYRLSHPGLNPKLTMRHSISGTDMTITHNNSVATGLSAGAELDVSYTGKANMRVNPSDPAQTNFTSKFTVSILIDIVNAAHTFTAFKYPVFSNVLQSKSDWTNSVYKENGGMLIEISNIKHTAIGANTITLEYQVAIKQWGSSDVTMELDLDDLTTIA